MFSRSILKNILLYTFRIISKNFYKYILQPVYNYFGFNDNFILIFNFLNLLFLGFILFIIMDFFNISLYNQIYCEPETLKASIIVEFFANGRYVTVSGSYVNYVYYTYGAKNAFVSAAKIAGYIYRELESSSLPSSSKNQIRDELTEQRGIFNVNKDNTSSNMSHQLGYRFIKLAPRANETKHGVDIVLIKTNEGNIIKEFIPKMPNKKNNVFNFEEVKWEANNVKLVSLMHNSMSDTSNEKKPLNTVYDIHKEYLPKSAITSRWKKTDNLSTENSVMNALIEAGLNSF